MFVSFHLNCDYDCDLRLHTHSIAVGDDEGSLCLREIIRLYSFI